MTDADSIVYGIKELTWARIITIQGVWGVRDALGIDDASGSLLRAALSDLATELTE